MRSCFNRITSGGVILNSILTRTLFYGVCLGFTTGKKQVSACRRRRNFWGILDYDYTGSRFILKYSRYFTSIRFFDGF